LIADDDLIVEQMKAVGKECAAWREAVERWEQRYATADGNLTAAEVKLETQRRELGQLQARVTKLSSDIRQKDYRIDELQIALDKARRYWSGAALIDTTAKESARV
jgi:chromosome segregation ATPase